MSVDDIRNSQGSAKTDMDGDLFCVLEFITVDRHYLTDS